MTTPPKGPRLSLAADCALPNPSAPFQRRQVWSLKKNRLIAEQLNEAI
jgi:hypothetical protein